MAAHTTASGEGRRYIRQLTTAQADLASLAKIRGVLRTTKMASLVSRWNNTTPIDLADEVTQSLGGNYIPAGLKASCQTCDLPLFSPQTAD